jgi:hypothetical protein
MKRLCSDNIYQRGLAYLKQDRVSNQTIHNNSLSGQVQGSQFYTYDVKIDVENNKLIPSCTCPYDYEDFCKHAISLLASWIKYHEQFIDIDLFFKELGKKSKDELLCIMQRWTYIYPNIVLKYYSTQSLDGLKRKLQKVFSSGSKSYDVPDIIGDLKEFDPILKEYEKKNDLESFNSIKYLVGLCFENLSSFDYLDNIEPFLERLIRIYIKIFQNLEVDWSIKKEIHKFNLKLFIKSSDDISEIISNTIVCSDFEEVETDFIENMILNEINLHKKNKKNDPDRLVSKLILLLVDLYENNKDYKKFICTCEKELQYCYNRYIQYLESTDAFDKAIFYCKKSLGFVTGFSQINLLVKLGDLEYKAENEKNSLSYYLKAFKINPLYCEEAIIAKIRKISLTLNSWPQVKKELISILEQKEYYHMLIEIYLKDDDFESAYKIASQTINCDLYDKEIVAKALIKGFPNKAAELYRIIGEGFVSKANIESYRKALHYFRKMQKIYFSSGQSGEFFTYVDKLLSNNIKKRLLHKELSRLRHHR